ncbi:uncharacterized protein PV06_11502 [Exophiala oligosperma]|uniref:CCHC-type domain-containing protein n=1 Tax=Exophiala oligosperma TaxID=215243 RepID=A0A0D2D1W3_9EURO|nr:uncharacterized protein PV06_11502 [Exophiala oligosperma]KIW36205.1 hypothetical protein PV06_11502 [Exophiala oligosperma]
MAPRWPQVNNGPENINEHATYLREASHQLQAADKGRANQIPWNVVQPYIASTVALIRKVLQQPSMSAVLQQIQDAAKGIEVIRRDITVVKGSVGLGTTPLNIANFTGGKTATPSWAQVAAQAKGAMLPPPPPPIQQSPHAYKTSAPVTAYRDRVVTVRLKDQSFVQRYRSHPVAWTRQQVQASIRQNTPSNSVNVVAAYQLKSGDIQIFTSTTTEARQLKEHKGWLKGLGEQAELIMPTYGVIVHGIPTNSISIKDQKATIQHMLADNYAVISCAEISYVGWLTKEASLKRASSIVVEFTDPEMANAIIYAGMAWDGHIHQCQLYDRACRVEQCFRCYHYGHIATQCNASQTCGYCAELHESRHCKQKGLEGFVPRCTVCKGAHTAWSNACPARKKDLERVEQAKQIRSIYWHVPAKANTTRPRTDNTTSSSTVREAAQPRDPCPASPIPAQATTRGQATALTGAPEAAQGPHEVIATQTPEIPAGGEEWTTPATQQEPAQQQPDLPIDPRLRQTEEDFALVQASQGNAARLSTQRMDAPNEAFEMQDTGAWLDNIFNDNEDVWIPDTAHAELEDVQGVQVPDTPAPVRRLAHTRCGTNHRQMHDNMCILWGRLPESDDTTAAS